MGGGAVLDVVGYAAAMAHRGIRLIRFPTTVLAQDDSAVGVKNGINAFGQKNYLGTFTPPSRSSTTRVPDDAAGSDWRAGSRRRSRRADQGPAFFDYIEQHARPAAAREICGDGAGDPAIRGAAPAAHRHRRRSVRDGIVAPARLRPLVGAQARAADQPSAAATAKRSRSDRPRLDLLSPLGFPRRRRLAAYPRAAVQRSGCRSTHPS